MYCIGLTGSIASGKSTVASLFAKKGIDIINADHIARALVDPDQPALNEIIHHFGTTVLTPDGELNRRHLRELIINDPSARLWLENLLHPLIRKKIQLDIEQCKSPYCIIEIPLLTNKSDYPWLNRILLVLADTEQQITRLMARDHCSREQACAFLSTTRADDEKRKSIANDVFINDGAINKLQKKVDILHAQYVEQSRIK